MNQRVRLLEASVEGRILPTIRSNLIFTFLESQLTWPHFAHFISHYSAFPYCLGVFLDCLLNFKEQLLFITLSELLQLWNNSWYQVSKPSNLIPLRVLAILGTFLSYLNLRINWPSFKNNPIRIWKELIPLISHEYCIYVILTYLNAF